MNAALFTCDMPMPELSLLESKICVHIYVITFLNKFVKCVCVRACVCACVRACVRACVCVNKNKSCNVL